MDKNLIYSKLVQKRKTCFRCVVAGSDQDIVNPSCSEYDVNEIGHWSVWQSNLNTEILIIGQDWGDYLGFLDCEGEDTDSNPTNNNLQKLLKIIGVTIGNSTQKDGRNGKVFLTNSILCLKNGEGGMQGKIKREWVENCGHAFLKPLINLVKPRIVISLGSWAYVSMRNIFGLEKQSFQRRIKAYSSSSFQPIELPDHAYYFPMYHCGRRVVNSQGGIDRQAQLWEKIKAYYSTVSMKC